MRVQVASLVCLVFVLTFGSTSSRRHIRQNEEQEQEQGHFEEWQKRYLEKIQLLGREGGLSEAEWQGITKFDPDVCYERACLESALEIMQATNFTVSPCQTNLWLTYVCSRRVNGPDNINQPERLMSVVEQKTKEMLRSKAKSLENEFLLKEAQTYYYQCTHKAQNDEQDVKDILEYLNETYGEWPMMSNRDPGPKFNWFNMTADLNRITRPGYTPLLLKVKVDHTDPRIQLDLGQLSFPITQEDFIIMMKRIQKASGKNKPARLDQLQGMTQFINSASLASMVQSYYPTYSIAQLQQKTNQYFRKNNINQFEVNWLEFFQRVLAGSDIQVTDQSPTVTLPFDRVMEVMKSVNHALANKQTRAVANALHFQLASTLFQESTLFLDDLNSFKCREQSGSREAICYARTTENFGYSLGKTYLKLFYDAERETPAIERLMAKIQQGYIDVIDDTPWMQKATKEYLKDKIRHMRTFIAEPDWTRDPQKLQDFYRTLEAFTDKNSSYPRNYLAVTSWAYMKKMSWSHRMAKLTSVKDLTIYDMEWSRYLGTVQAQFHKVLNQARIEGGIVQSPLFSVDRPGFMNFGGLGMVLAHEVGHSYDSSGRKFNKEGEEGEFWDPVSRKKYEEWVKRILEDYGSAAHQTSETSAETIDPVKTVDEDISDILAVYISYFSYEEYLKELKSQGKTEKILPGLKEYSPQKLFYMKYGNMWCNKKDVQDHYNDLLGIHSSGNTRATMPLKRSKQFAKTFGCKVPKQL